MSAETDYQQRARQHAPQTITDIARAAHELCASGYGDHDVARILDLDVNAARQLLAESAHTAAA